MDSRRHDARVEIDDRIRERPELAQAVGLGTDYLLSQATDTTPPDAVAWRFADADGKLVQVTLSDSPGDGHRVQRNFQTTWILDPVNRKLCVTKVWVELLNKRLDQQFARVNAGINELEREEHDGVQIAQ